MFHDTGLSLSPPPSIYLSVFLPLQQPENYDHPPASNRRPSRARDPSFVPPPGRLEQSLYEYLSARHPQVQLQTAATTADRGAETEDEDSELDSILSEIRFGNHTSQLLNRLIEQESGGSPRDNHPPRSRDQLLYLRNLINSGANRTGSEASTRALETLNQEVEDHYIDETRNGNMTYMQAQAALDNHRLVFGVDDPRSSVPTFQDFFQQFPSTANPATLEPRPPTNRTLRRRAFRPDLRDSLPTPSLMPQQPPQQPQTGRDRDRRLKRRKLDADDHREGSRGFNYGHQGQVVPGPLKMEIASCDGGNYDPDGECLLPDSILRNDNNVYSTKSDRCNIVLRHKNEAPFCLKKLIIMAPRSGFDAPIQEGMVFVTMDSDEALARTVQYQIQYSSRRRRRERRHALQPSQEYLNGSSRPPLQSVERTVLVGPDPNVASSSEGRSTRGPQTDGFRVTTEYNCTSTIDGFGQQDDDDMLPSVAELETVNDDDDFMSDSDEDSASDDDEEESNTMTNFSNRRRLEAQSQRRLASMRRQASDPTQRHRQPSLIDPNPPASLFGAGSSTAASSSAPDALKPYARFFIEREKSMVTIKFDPPPSGRFILIKLWNPRPDHNLDIQTIIAHGYAGPRFFPSSGFR
ncbi:uncharacterized protein N7483_001654 [Penicillium malachiteum]|uniref:uncharacterized protein n=1 Tax=Penicillium malachiteum TaxID=1324776 RepID=UPI0025498A55|nr:uncharacterized protein N7483_001654 [Penicillium malachiteum]KAJ5736529.1 hypothetical protein N7483_001654 [Penicillium malachiteum]